MAIYAYCHIPQQGVSPLQCPNEECRRTWPVGVVAFQLTRAIQSYIRRYQEGWVICEEPTCGVRTRARTVHGTKCLRAQCTGELTFEVGMIFARIFN
jgi:DNA polymerase alpha subunit A